MALSLPRTHEQSRWRIVALMAAAVATIIAVGLLFPTNAFLAFGLVLALWTAYAALRLREARRRRVAAERPAAVAFTDESERDKETGLPGRGELTSLLTREMARCQRFGDKAALFVLDSRIVNFRPTDPSVRPPSPAAHIAKVLVEQGRATDVVLRIDMTRFAVLLADASEQGAELYSERIRSAMSKAPYSTNADGSGVWVRTWAGWAVWDPEMTRPAHFVTAALAHMEDQRLLYESEQARFGRHIAAS